MRLPSATCGAIGIVGLAVGAAPLAVAVADGAGRHEGSGDAAPPTAVVAEPVAAPQIDDPEELLARMPPFTSTERIPILEDNGYYPCSDCHADQEPDLNVRELDVEHQDIVLVHGGGRYWCTTCHGDDRDHLVSLKGKPISFDKPYLLCGQCHFERQRDYFLGGHGKRIGSWLGPKKLAVCTDCHDAHNPRIQPRKPQPPPRLRSGLGDGAGPVHTATPVWRRRAGERH